MGDTLQATLPNGAKAYFEHAGPVETDTTFYIVGKDEAWTMYGHLQNSIQIRGMNPSNMKGTRKRPIHIEFKDGGKYYFTYAGFEMDGAVSSNRVVRIKGSSKVFDKVNKITSVVNFVEPAKAGGLGSWFGGKTEIK